MSDIYSYSNGCLRNKLNITDSSILKTTERNLSELRLKQVLPKGEFDYTHLKAIHYHLFQDVYVWAGTQRTINISKVEQFCIVDFIQPMVNKTFSKLQNDCYLKNIKNTDEFIAKFCDYFADINAIHPFRDGNGRTQRAFFSYLSFQAGYGVDFSNVDSKEWIEACRKSMKIDNSKLFVLFKKIIYKL
jgi:cell filamentation protein